MIIESLVNQPHWKQSYIIDKETKQRITKVEVNNSTYNQCFVFRTINGNLEPQRLQTYRIGYLHNRIPWMVLSAEAYGVLSDNVQDHFPSPDSLLERDIEFMDDFENKLGDLKGTIFSTKNQKKRFREILFTTSIKRTCLGILINIFPNPELDSEEEEYLTVIYDYLFFLY
jgi:hypothetical protein